MAETYWHICSRVTVEIFIFVTGSSLLKRCTFSLPSDTLCQKLVFLFRIQLARPSREPVKE